MRTITTAALISVLSIALLPAGHAQAPPDARFEAIVSLAESKMREYRVPGVALGVFDRGAVAIRGLGITNVEDALPITDHTVFPIASISKTFAATAAMRLVEQGKLDLKAPVRKYIPDFRVQDEAASRDATVWHLLTHTGGWEGQISGPDRGEDTLRNFVATMMPSNMQVAPPGAAWSYNNAGFSTLGRVIEVVTGQSINRAMRELMFQPLGLPHAGTSAGDFIVNRFAAGHSVRASGGPLLQRPFSPSASVTAGGIGICITDLLAYAKFHMGDGTSAKGERVLTRGSLDEMRRPQLRKHSYDDDMGIGWHLRTVGGVRVAAHGGTLGGHILLLEIAPERNFAIAILTNANSGWRLIQDVERAALGSYLEAAFAVNQAISHRGLVETLPRVEPLATQPNPAPYIGRYVRPMNSVTVRVEGGRVLMQVHPNSGEAQPAVPMMFYGPDRAVITEGPDRDQSVEFIRNDNGDVTWIRVTGRIGRLGGS